MTERLTLYKCKMRDLVLVSQGLLKPTCAPCYLGNRKYVITKFLSYGPNQINIGWINSNFFQSLVNVKVSEIFGIMAPSGQQDLLGSWQGLAYQ